MSNDAGIRSEASLTLRKGAGRLEFDRLPFALAPDADFLFWAEPHRRAAERLERGIDGLAPILLLTGEIGAGKTTLLQHFLSAPRPNATVGRLACFGARPDDIWLSILLAFDQQVPQGPAPLQLAALRSFCMAEGRAGRRCILVADEAQGARGDELEALRLLTNMDVGGAAAVQVVLVGQPALRTRLEDEAHAPLVARIGADAHLSPMSGRDTAGYVRHRLARVGGRRDLFTPRALAEVHQIAGGIARRTNMLCDLCLAEARRRDVAEIDDPLVRDVLAEARASGTSAGLLGFGRDPARQEHAGASPRTGSEGAPDRERDANRSAPADAGVARMPHPGGEGEAGWSRATPVAANSTRRVARPEQAPQTPAAQEEAPAGSDEPKAPRPSPTPPSAAPAVSGEDAAEDVRQLAFSAMASLADLEVRGQGAPRQRRKTDPAPQGKASRGEPASPPPTQATRKVRPAHLHGPSAVLAAAAVGLVAIGFGYHGLWSAVERLLRTDTVEAAMSAAALEAPPKQVSDPPSDPARADVPRGGPDRIAGRGSIDAPRPAPTSMRLTTPSLPTVAGPEATADDLYSLALDLALVDAETAAIAFARAASRGHARAAYYLAQLYETGDGVPRNLALARAWYAASELPKAAPRLEALSEMMPEAGGTAAPRLLSAARTSDDWLELVWASTAEESGVDYVVEVFEDPSGPPMLADRVAHSALRVQAPSGELLWRVTAESPTAAAASQLQRIPAAEPRGTGPVTSR